MLLWRKSVFALSGCLYQSGASYSLVASVKAIVDGGGRVAIPHKSRRDTIKKSHLQILD